MRALAEFVMRGRKQAILVALLSGLVPILGWMVTTVIAGLVTLRRGAWEGFLIVAVTSVPSIVLALFGKPALLLYQVVYGTAFVWLLAIVLREQRTWQRVLLVTSLLGVMAVLIIHGTHPHLLSTWETRFTQVFARPDLARYTTELPPAQLQDLIKTFAHYATGTQTVFVLLSALSTLMLARWLQSILYNPGGFRTEFYAIELSLFESGVLLACGLLGFLGHVSVALDCLPILLLPCLIAGLSLIHYWVSRTNQKWFLIIGFYILLILTAPYGLVVPVVLAFIDSGYHFRHRLTKQS